MSVFSGFATAISSAQPPSFNIEGLDRESSPIFKDEEGRAFLNTMGFKISGSPSDEWIKKFKDFAYKTIDEDVVDSIVFDNWDMYLCTAKTYVHYLQEFIDLLKEAFEKTNKFIQNEIDSEIEWGKNVNDTLDNLKF